MTEDEAKTKVCCGGPAIAVAVVSTGGAMAGAPIAADAGPLCIASACMAWRFSDTRRYRHEEVVQEQRPVGDGWYAINPSQRGSGKMWHRDVPLGVEGGFCGLAGAPQ